MKRTLRIVRLFSWLVIATLAPSTALLAADFSAIWDGGNGSWDDPLHWNTNPNYPNNGGGITYDATINNGTVTLDRDITIQRLFVNNFATISGNGPWQLTLNEGLTCTGGIFTAGTTINLAASSTSSIIGNLNGTINNAGTVNDSRLTFTGTINNLAGATWTTSGINPQNGMFTPPSAGIFNNQGTLVVTPPGSSGISYLRTTFNNTGNVNLGNMVTLDIDRGSSISGTFNLGAQSNLTFENYTFGYGSSINGGGTTTVNGSLNILGYVTINSNIVNHGTLSVQEGAILNLNGSLSLPAFDSLRAPGVLQLSGGTINSAQAFNFHEGTLKGWGTINTNLTLSDNVILSLQLGGTMSGSGTNHYDSLNVNGATVLGGNLAVSFANGFENLISNSNTFTLLTSSSGLSGSFANVVSGSRMDTADYLGTFLVQQTGNHIGLSQFVPNTRWLGGSGNWSDGTRWLSNPLYPNDTPTTHYSVVMRGSDSINLDTNIAISRFIVTGGFLFGNGNNTLTVTDKFICTGGDTFGSIINLAAGSISSFMAPVLGPVSNINVGDLNNFGTVNQNVGISAGHAINNMEGGMWNAASGVRVQGTFNNFGEALYAVNNSTTFDDADLFAVTFNNSGSITVQGSGDFGLYQGTNTGSINLGPGVNLLITNNIPSVTYTFGTGAIVNGSGLFKVPTGARLDVVGDSTVNMNFTTSGTLKITGGALTVNGNFNQTAVPATTQLTGGTIASSHPLNFQSGSLTGNGTINGDLFSNVLISPGPLAATLTINGNVSLLNNSKLMLEIGGLKQGTQYDYIAISGAVSLNGILDLRALNGLAFQADPGDTFTLLTSSSLSGVLTNVANGQRIIVGTTSGIYSYQVNYGAGSPYGANNLVLSDQRPGAVPEPTSLVLFAGGIAIIGFLCLRRRKPKQLVRRSVD